MNFKHVILSFFLVALGFTSCVDDEFDAPPIEGQDPDLTATHTIAELKSAYSGELVEIGDQVFPGEEVIIRGLVISDDAEGNFFRQLYIQDESGGIEIRVDATELHNTLPVGRRVFVKCSGMWLGDFAGLIQLGLGPDVDIDQQTGEVDTIGLGRVPETLLDDYVFPGVLDQEVIPNVITLSELYSEPASEVLAGRIGSLVQLEDVEFAPGSVNLTYADPINNSAENRTIMDCEGNSIILRTSGFSSFAGERTPAENGTIVAVLGVFDGNGVLEERDFQLTIRNLDDVQFDGERCGGGGTGGEPITIKEVRDAFPGSETSAPEGVITGVVISDRQAGNIVDRNLFVQDGTAGIAIRFEDSHSFNLGEEISINVSGLELSEFNGLLQVNNVPLFNAESNGTGTMPSARVTDVETLLVNAEEWESTLIRIEDAELDGGSRISDVDAVSDATGSISVFTRNSADFADDPTPSGMVDVTAIVSDFNGSQILFRNGDDIEGGMTGGGGGEDTLSIRSLREAFIGGASSAPDGVIIATVISDDANMNTNNQNLIVQDETAGIVVRFSDPHGIPLGSQVVVDVSGLELSEFRGALQVNGVPLANAEIISSGNMPEPIVLTIAELLDSFEFYESRLVRVNDVSFSVEGGSTYGDDVIISDGTDEILLFTRGQATFSGASVPTDTKDIVAYVTEFDIPELSMRNLDDIID